ncbi:hypothetical protein CCP3SC1_1930003 [Gammaproteobacteria bacterium]
MEQSSSFYPHATQRAGAANNTIDFYTSDGPRGELPRQRYLGSERWLGECGIGKLASSSALDVNGDVNASGLYMTGGNPVAWTDNLGNVALGRSKLSTITTGASNLSIGNVALSQITSGDHNIGIGNGTLKVTTTGAYNVGLGYNVLYTNDSGNSNIAFGNATMKFNVSGNDNIAIGEQALYNATTSMNVAVGSFAGRGITSGLGNIAIGYGAGYNNNSGRTTTGTGNILIGNNVIALLGTTNQYLNIGNTIYGDMSQGQVGIGKSNPAYALDVVGSVNATGQFLAPAGDSAAQPGFSWNSDSNMGVYRVAADTLGFSTGGTERVRIDSAGNVGIGTVPSTNLEVLVQPAAPTTNTALANAGFRLSGSALNSALDFGINGATPGAYYAGWIQRWNKSAPNLFPLLLNPLGGNVGISSMTTPNTTLEVGGTGISTNTLSVNGASVFFNGLTVGSTGTTLSITAGGQVYKTSDRRLKDHIAVLPGVLTQLDKFRGVSYEWKNATTENRHTEIGVIAQEVEAAYPELVKTNSDGYKSVEYLMLTGVLVEAAKELKAQNVSMNALVQDLKAKNDEKDKAIEALRAKNDDIERRLELLEKK